jgi:agmatinase
MNILKIPFSAGSLGKAKGSFLAPDKIISFLNHEDLKISEVIIDQSNIVNSNKNIFSEVRNILNKKKSFLIGGDHSITFSAFMAFSELNNPGLLIFDAHPDCMQDFDPPTHEDFVKVLINKEFLKPENIVIVGLRSWHEDEINFLKNQKIRFFDMNNIEEVGIHEISDAIMSAIKKFSNLYISIDIDVVDPAFAPGTGYPEPGGLSSRQLLYMLNRIKNLKSLKMVDIVEVNPEKDVSDITSKLAAKIISELV